MIIINDINKFNMIINNNKLYLTLINNNDNINNDDDNDNDNYDNILKKFKKLTKLFIVLIHYFFLYI